MSDNPAATLATVLVIGIVALIGLQLIGPVMDATPKDATRTQNLVRLDGSGWFDVGGDEVRGTNETVFLTRGNAIRLNGADDAAVESTSALDLSTGPSFTVCTWARVNESITSGNRTAVSANGRVLIQHNQTEGNWSAWYFNESSRDSYTVDITAPDQPGNLTHVCAWHNGSSFTIYRNNTQGESEDTTVSKTEDFEVNATNWNGTIEETRVFDEALNNSQRQALVDSPSQPLANATRTARLMYDEGRGTTTFIIFADIDASITNGTWVDGHPEQQVSAGSDYRWRKDGPQVRVVSSGALADAPVLYADYDAEPDAIRVGVGIGESLELVVLVMLALVAGMVIAVVSAFR